MKKYLMILTFFLFSESFANYTTPGTGVSWDLDSLVSNSSGSVTTSGSDYLFNDTLTISASDTIRVLSNAVMKFGTGVFIDINGILIIDPPDSVKITAQDTTLKYLGLKFEDQSDGSLLRNLIMEYGNAIRMLDCDILIDSCTIRYNTLSSSFSSGAISFFRSNSVVSNCKIFRNRRAAITSGANIASSPQIINNHIYENNSDNANVPQINFGATGPFPMIIKGNVITGLYDNCGGISFFPIGSIPNAIIEDNIIKHNRYGIAIAGGNSNIYINNNIIDSNNIQGNPNLGGSGINFNGSSTQNCIVTRNTIRGNLWGITVQSTAKPNLGDLSSPDTADVGLNQIYGNGNSGQIYDLYNNTPDSLKAENNYWGTSNLDSVEAHIFHKPDDGSLGNVDYLPLASVNVNLVAAIQGLNRSGGTMIRTDTITVYLREAFSPYAIIDSANASLDSVSYSADLKFYNAGNSSYYIDVKHFNSVETWSSVPVILRLNSDASNMYSFTISSSQAYENNLILNNGKYCFYSGDVNQDGYVDITDIIEVKNDASVFLTGVRLPTDINGDGTTGLDDLLIVYNNSSAFVRLRSPLNP